MLMRQPVERFDNVLEFQGVRSCIVDEIEDADAP